jgi:hypothetical protein
LAAHREFGPPLSTFAEHYADQNERDHDALLVAVKRAGVQAVTDI